MATRMLQRRGTAAEWAAANPVLGDGEIGVEEDTGIVKIGDGVAAWNALANTYIRKSAMDAAYSPIGAIPSGLVDAAGDLIVASADNTVVRLPKGTNGQRLSVKSDGSVGWESLPAVENPYAIIDAAEDLIVGSAADTVKRLAKGTNGQVLTVNGSGILAWATPSAVDSSKVAKAGDTMTGPLTLEDGANAASTMRIRNVSGWIQILGDDLTTLRFELAQDGRLYAHGGLYDSGNRVYSAVNPPPVSGMTILGTYLAVPNATTFNAFTFTAPTSGRVVAYGFMPDQQGYNVQLSINGGTNKYYSHRGVNLIGGGVPFGGLTPGATYTLHVTNDDSTKAHSVWVEG